MVSLSINGMLVKVPEGTTILEAAKKLEFQDSDTLSSRRPLCGRKLQGMCG